MQDAAGETPLHYAALAGQLESLQVLLKHRADPEVEAVQEISDSKFNRFFSSLSKTILPFSVFGDSVSSSRKNSNLLKPFSGKCCNNRWEISRGLEKLIYYSRR